MLLSDGKSRARSEAGFTLAELLIVLAIFSLTLAITAPQFGKLIGARSDQVHLERFYLSIKNARRQAIRTSQEIVFTLNVTTGEYGILGEKVSGQLPESWAIDAVASRAEQTADGVIGIRYWPSGASTGGEITLAHQGADTLISVDWLTGLATKDLIE